VQDYLTVKTHFGGYMFGRHLHPSPFGLALGLFLVALWAAVWIGLVTAIAAEAQTRRPGWNPGPARVATQRLEATA
jgi:hypothetical protein